MPRHPVAAIAVRRPMPIPRAIALLLAAMMLVAATLSVASPARAAGGDGLRAAANGYRQDRNLAPVVGTALLDDIANRRAARMADTDELEHDMDYVSRRLNEAGVCWSGFGEIIAWDSYPDYDYDHTMGMWWDSDPHRAIMLGEDYNAAGGAWDTASDGGHYSVMVFVTLCGDSVAVTASSKLHPEDVYNPDRQLVLRAERVTGYRFDRNGDVLSRKTVRLSHVRRDGAGGRARVNGRAWLKATSGPLSGYWVRESWLTFVRGRTQFDQFDPVRLVTVQPGVYHGLKLDRLGRVQAQQRHRFYDVRTLETNASAVISGKRYYRVSSGQLDGYWLRDTGVVDPV